MDYFQTLDRWFEVSTAIKHLKAEEQALREGLFHGTFPTPREGVNSYPLPDGRVVKGTHVVNRKLLQEEWKTRFKEVGLPKEVRKELIVVKYDFDIKVYKKLPDHLRKNFDTVLEIKPGLPKLEIKFPKEEK
jgi:hypothetical protein